MIIPKPKSFKLDPKHDKDYQTTRLFFDQRGSSDFHLKGAIAWPKTIPRKDAGQDLYYPGFVLMSGLNLNDPNKPIWIFEVQEFRTIDNWLKPEGNLMENPAGGYWYGLAYFLNRVYAQYGCRAYFFGGQTEEIYQLYQGEMIESLKIPEGQLQYPIDPIEVNIDEIGSQLISEYVAMDKLSADDNSRFSELMKSPDVNENNGVHALKCLLTGFKKYPWVDLRMMRGHANP